MTTGLRRFVRQPAGPGSAGAVPGEAPGVPPGVPPAIRDVLAARAARSGRDAGIPQDAERCEMCREVLTDRHGHVVDLDKRSIACTCRACYLLFTHDGAAGGRYRAVPEHVYHDPGRPLTEADWNELQIPVAMAFFFINSALGPAGRVVAGYPSPGGATECELDLAAWDRLAAAYPLLGSLAPDVEAIFVNRAGAGRSANPGGASPGGASPGGASPGGASPGGASPGGASPGGRPPQTPELEVFLIPIDECYGLVGELRLRWQGFDGGAEVRASLAAFLDGLRRRAVPLDSRGER